MVDSLNKSVMKQIIAHFSESPLSRWRIDHKRLWMEYLKNGKLPFTPKELHSAIQEIVNKPGNRPRGEKLLHLRKRNAFTLKMDKTPYRPEEALERFVIVSNDDNFYNQVPVGRGKESIDLVIEHSKDSIDFIELKPWNSGDSPLYAIVESLKNLIKYKTIHEQKICEINDYTEVALCILAPEEYYQHFFLLDQSNLKVKKSIIRTTELLQELAIEFNTTIAIRSITLTSNSFNQTCARIYDQRGLSGQQIATIAEHEGIASLQRSNWVDVASSNTSLTIN